LSFKQSLHLSLAMSTLSLPDEQHCHPSSIRWVCEDPGLAYHLASFLPVREMCSLRATNLTHKECTQQLLVQRLASQAVRGSAVDRMKALFAVGEAAGKVEELAGSRCPPLISALDSCLNHCMLSVRWAAASVLVKYKAVPTQSKVPDMTLTAVLSEDSAVSSTAVTTYVVPRLHDADPAVRCASLFLLRHLVTKGDRDLIRASVRLLTDVSDQVRKCAAKVLSEVVDTWDDSIKIPLAYLLQDPECGVRKASALALASLSKQAKQDADFACLPQPLLPCRSMLKRSASRHARTGSLPDKSGKRRRTC